MKIHTIFKFFVIFLTLLSIFSFETNAQDLQADEVIEGYFLCKKGVFKNRGDVHSNWTTPDWKMVKQGIHYKYTATDLPEKYIPLENDLRSMVLHNDEIKLHLYGLDAGSKFKLRLVYLSNTDDRVFSLKADDELLQEEISLQAGEPRSYVLDLPSSVYQDEAVDLRFIRNAGHNVVLSAIELWGEKKESLVNLEIDIQGDFRANIFGTVRDAYQDAVENASLELTLEGTDEKIKLKTDREGNFRTAVPQTWRNEEDKWIFASARKGRMHGNNILASMEVFIPRLSPKPHHVHSVKEKEIDLKGVWSFNPDPPDCIYDPDLDISYWANIEVPGEWGMQGFEVAVDSAAAYRRTIHIPEDWRDRRVKIRFDAVYSETDIWLNGIKVGHHMSTYTPFEVDVTRAVVPGKPNVLAMEVTGESLADDNTANYMMIGRRAGGIIRRTSAFVLPEVNIALMHVETSFDMEYEDATLKVFLEIANEGKEDVENVTIQFDLTDTDIYADKPEFGPAFFELGDIKAGEYRYETIEIPVSSPRHWNAETPNLYYLDGTLGLDGEDLQVTRRRIGFRQLEIRGNQVYINGSPTRLRGMARQDSDPLWGRTVPEETLRREMEILDQTNVNNVYTCAFSPDELILDLADELGMYMFEEPSTCWIGWWNDNMESRQYHFRQHRVAGNTDPKMYMEFLRPVVEMIQRGRSHPSAMTWMIADESAFIPSFERVRRCVKTLDPTRPVHFAWDVRDETIFDLGSHHYPSYEQLEEYSHSTRPVIFDQFAHIYWNRFVLSIDPGLRNEWAHIFVPFWEKTWDTPAIWGGQVFNYTDDIFLMPSGEVLGYGSWGIIDPWRRVKPEVWHIKKAYSPTKIVNETVPLQIPENGDPLEIQIENRYDFTNLKDLRIEWAIGDEKGRLTPDIPPHTSGVISLLPETKELRGKILHLNFFKDGQQVDRYSLVLGEPAIKERVNPEGEVELSETDDSFVIRGNEFDMEIVRNTGALNLTTHEGKMIVAQGPELVILQENNDKHSSGYPVPKPALPSLAELNQKCTGWETQQVTATRSEQGVDVTIQGSYHEAAGQYRLHIGGNGIMSVEYEFVTKVETHPRQIGLLLYLPATYDEVSWKRQGMWSTYPDGHIGRNQGVARAFRDPVFPKIDARTKPPWPWHLDSNLMGTNDFRATRTHILQAALKDSEGTGIAIHSDGTQQVRSFIEGDLTGMIISDYYAAGLGGFPGEQLKTHLFKEKLPAGSVITGQVNIELLK
jgi:hypothetical protein